MKDCFISEKCNENSLKWIQANSRLNPLYSRDNDIRSEFERDYTRILHSFGYRRLKHKTQVFFAPQNDHICTRIEHVNHVSSVSSTIAKYLGLNDQLTSAIAIGHDIGHAPFGHHGEDCINSIMNNSSNKHEFWHEKNSLFFVDNIETLQDPNGNSLPLNLTYGVRDGIICHCGEIDESAIKPRNDFINLMDIQHPGQVQSFTWEGCVVKIADKIAYLGRDIEDAIQYQMLDMNTYRKLRIIMKDSFGDKAIKEINTTVLINDCIVDLCNNSNPSEGLKFSDNFFNFLKNIKLFNYENIYKYWRIEEFKKYATLIIQTIYNTLIKLYPFVKTRRQDLPIISFINLHKTFYEWLIKYTNFNLDEKIKYKFKTNVLFDIENPNDYSDCVLYYISGMTDQYAIKVYEEIISF